MIEALMDWVRSLLLVAFVVTLIQMLLPDNGLRPYVRLVFGLVLLAVMIRPVIGIVEDPGSWQADWDGLFTVPSAGKADEWIAAGMEIERRGFAVAADQLTARFSDQIEAMVALVAGVETAQVTRLELGDTGVRSLSLVIHGTAGGEQVSELLRKYFGIPEQQIEIAWVSPEGDL